MTGDRVRKLAHDGRLLTTEHSLVGSLAHMQANRLLGLDRELEDRSAMLWALTLRTASNGPVNPPVGRVSGAAKG